MWFPLQPGSLGFTGSPGWKGGNKKKKAKQGHVLREMKPTVREEDMSLVLSCCISGEPNWPDSSSAPSILNFPSGQQLRVSDPFHRDILYTQLYEQRLAVELPERQALLVTNTGSCFWSHPHQCYGQRTELCTMVSFWFYFGIFAYQFHHWLGMIENSCFLHMLYVKV